MRRDLRPLFDPASVAIVGASDDRAKWGYSVAYQALRAGDRRPIHLVNRRGGRVLGRPAAASLAAIGERVDLAVIAVPVAAFESAVDEALAAGARAIVGITAGFAELGEAGAALQAAVVARVRAAGAILVGPNCLGVVDNSSELYLSSDRFRDGPVALLSQSGNLAIELDLRFGRHGLGCSRFVSLGNQADVSVVDLVTSCASDDRSAVIAVYAEDFADGRGFAIAAAAAAEKGKPVVLLTAGAGEASARGALSHTGAMTSPSEVVTAACRDSGVHLVSTPRELTAVVAALVRPYRPAGRRTAILTDGGGHGSVAADVAEHAGLVVPVLEEPLRSTLSGLLWSQSAVGNPVDLAGAGEQDPASYPAALAALLASDQVDAVLMTGFFGGYAAFDEGMSGGALGEGELAAGAEIARVIGMAGKPVAVQSMYPGSPSCKAIAAAAPVFDAVEDAARSLAAATGETGATGWAGATGGEHGGYAVSRPPVPADPITDAGYFGVRRLLAGAGVKFPPAYECGTADQIRAAAAAIGAGPYVLKAMNLLHKSDAGGVALGLADTHALLTEHRSMHERLGAATYSVEAMAGVGGGIELIAGVKQDPRFGPVLMVGLGGVHAEALRDTGFALAPVTVERAAGLLLSLRTAVLLTGSRGSRPVDVTAAARAIAALSEVAAAHPEVGEIEINPLLVTPSGALALDARCVLRLEK